MFSQKGRTMDVSSIGVANSAQYLQKTPTGIQAPLTAAKQEEQAAQVFAQVAAQSVSQQQPPPPSPTEVSKTAAGRILDIET